MSNEIKLVTSSEEQRLFLSLPKKLYQQSQCMQDEKMERELLGGKHILSQHFTFFPFIMLHEERIIARVALTIYADDCRGYVGFFEAIDDEQAVSELFDVIMAFAQKQKCDTLVGPVNASFWLGYRLKVNRFAAEDSPYSMEPYNLPYYEKLWLSVGFAPIETYISSRHIDKHRITTIDFSGITDGYHLTSPTKKSWAIDIKIVYQLINKLYADFPIYKAITETEFIKLFQSLKYIADFELIKILYFNNEAVGFSITLPDYTNTINKKLSISMLLELLKKRQTVSRFLILYLGVEPAHFGAGRLLIGDTKTEIRKRNGFGIGALRREKNGNHSSGDKDYRYVLFEKTIEPK